MPIGVFINFACRRICVNDDASKCVSVCWKELISCSTYSPSMVVIRIENNNSNLSPDFNGETIF